MAVGRDAQRRVETALGDRRPGGGVPSGFSIATLLLAEGKTGKEALRALKRQISDAIFACLQADARRGEEPGGNWGTTLIPGRPALTPNAGSLGKPLSGLPPTPLLPFPRRCHPVRAGGRVKDGRSPAAQRRPQGVLAPVAREPIMPAAEKGGASAHGQLPRPEAAPASPQRSALDRETKRCSICAAYRPGGRCRDGARRWVICTRVLIWAGPVSRSVAIAGRVRIEAPARDCLPVMRGQLVRLRPGIDRSALGFLPAAVREHLGSSAICAGDSSFWHRPSIGDAPGRMRPFAGSLPGGALAVLAAACRRRGRPGGDYGCGGGLPPVGAAGACPPRGRRMPAGSLAGYRG
jgi:hypothetical protein